MIKEKTCLKTFFFSLYYLFEPLSKFHVPTNLILCTYLYSYKNQYTRMRLCLYLAAHSNWLTVSVVHKL